MYSKPLILLVYILVSLSMISQCGEVSPHSPTPNHKSLHKWPFQISEWITTKEKVDKLGRLPHRAVLEDIKTSFQSRKWSEVLKQLKKVRGVSYYFRLTSSQRYIVQLISSTVNIKYGKLSKAMNNLFEATNMIEQPIEAHHFLSVLFFQSGKITQTIQQLKLCLFYDPTSIPHLHRLGIVLYLSGSIEEGMFYWGEAIRLGGKDNNLEKDSQSASKSWNPQLFQSFLLSTLQYEIPMTHLLDLYNSQLSNVITPFGGGMDGKVDIQLEILKVGNTIWEREGLVELSLHIMNNLLDQSDVAAELTSSMTSQETEFKNHIQRKFTLVFVTQFSVSFVFFDGIFDHRSRMHSCTLCPLPL